jgi:hypothetical protein
MLCCLWLGVQGDTNSTVVMRNVVRAKMVCNPVNEAYNSAKSFGSLKGFPPNNVSILDGVCIFAPNGTDQVGCVVLCQSQGPCHDNA